MSQPWLLPINIQRIQQVGDPFVHSNPIKLKDPDPERPLHRLLPDRAAVKAGDVGSQFGNKSNKKHVMINLEWVIYLWIDYHHNFNLIFVYWDSNLNLCQNDEERYLSCFVHFIEMVVDISVWGEGCGAIKIC